MGQVGHGVQARRTDYTVADVDHRTAAAFVAARHYSKGAAKQSEYRHGLFRDGQLVGVALWMPPLPPAAKSVAPDDWHSVTALSRLAVDDAEPKNATSLLLGASMRKVGQAGKYRWGLTYADSAQGHTGAIYRATNWTYVGEVKGHPTWVDADGRHVSVKATVNRTYAQMRALGYTMIPGQVKHKFVVEFPRARARRNPGLTVQFKGQGRVGDNAHRTLVETGTLPAAALLGLKGARGEHRLFTTRGGRRRDWDAFVASIRQEGIREPVLVVVEPTKHLHPGQARALAGEALAPVEAFIYEGNHRVRAAVEAGVPVPVEVRYFGHAERKVRMTEAGPVLVTRRNPPTLFDRILTAAQDPAVVRLDPGLVPWLVRNRTHLEAVIARHARTADPELPPEPPPTRDPFEGLRDRSTPMTAIATRAAEIVRDRFLSQLPVGLRPYAASMDGAFLVNLVLDNEGFDGNTIVRWRPAGQAIDTVLQPKPPTALIPPGYPEGTSKPADVEAWLTRALEGVLPPGSSITVTAEKERYSPNWHARVEIPALRSRFPYLLQAPYAASYKSTRREALHTVAHSSELWQDVARSLLLDAGWTSHRHTAIEGDRPVARVERSAAGQAAIDEARRLAEARQARRSEVLRLRDTGKHRQWAAAIREAAVAWAALGDPDGIRTVRDLGHRLPSGWKTSSSTYSGTLSYRITSPAGLSWSGSGNGVRRAVGDLLDKLRWWAGQTPEGVASQDGRGRTRYVPPVFGLEPLDGHEDDTEDALARAREAAARVAARFPG